MNSTMTPWIQSEINKFDPQVDLDRASTPPSSWYTKEEFLELEKQTVFKNNWLYAGRVDQIKKPGDYFTGRFLAEPYIIAMGKDSQVRAFYNVCKHHATCVAQGSGNTAQFVCPYHGWTYETSGELRAAPRTNGIKDLDPIAFGLKPLHLKSWGPYYFIHFGDHPSDLSQDLSKLMPALCESGFQNLSFFKSVTYSMDCNWKVFVDNYLDGGYHVAHLHKDLSKKLNLNTYTNEIHTKLSIQYCGGKEKSGRLGSQAIYAWIHPNLMINRYGPFLDLNWVIPISAQKTVVVFDYYVEPKMLSQSEFLENALKDSHQVQVEDQEICALVQEGLNSFAYHQGRYSPQFEDTALHFHRLLAQDFATQL